MVGGLYLVVTIISSILVRIVEKRLPKAGIPLR